MYIPELFKNENQTEIEQFISENSFAIVVNQIHEKLHATHIPLLLETNQNGQKVLTGHMSKLNPQAQNFQNNTEVLVIFSGPHSYISSSWYDHENVPTWNYLAVHVSGKVSILNKFQTIESLKRMVNRYEKKSVNPVSVENFSEKTMREANGIIAFEIQITTLEAKKKLSQNRDDKNYKNIISELEKTELNQEFVIAQKMKKERPHL